MVGDLSSVFSEFEIFSNRQVIRMQDTELLTDMIIALENGIVRATGVSLTDMYHKYDKEFPLMSEYEQKIREVFTLIVEQLGEMRGSYLMKPFVIHSLFCAMMHNKYGLPGVKEKIGISPTGTCYSNVADAKKGLEALSRAHESKDTEGGLAEYVEACGGQTGTVLRQITRVKFLCMALNGQIQ